MIVTLNIPNEQVPDLIDFLCEAYDYQAQIYDPLNPMESIENPETRTQFAKRVVLFPLKKGFDKWLVRKAVRESSVESSITLTSAE